jgi:hypothetical protein
MSLSPTRYGRVFSNSFFSPESRIDAYPVKAHPCNPKRRCLWLLRKRPKRKLKRKRNNFLMVEVVVAV